MSTPDTELFLHFDQDADQRTLHPSRVVSATHNELTVELEDHDLALQSGQKILVYYNHRRQFVMQSASIEAVLESEPDDEGQKNALLLLERIGQPSSADGRECYRVSTLVAEAHTSFGNSDGCPLVDISPTGFAVVALEKHGVGNIVTATPQYRELQYTGPVCVQNVRPLSNGRFRYGVRCVSRGLQQVVQKIAMELQRQQLRRLTCRT